MSTIADSLKWCPLCNAATHHDSGKCSLTHSKEKVLLNEKKKALKDTLFIDKQCCVCGGVLPKPPKKYLIKFVADDGYTHFAKFSHPTKTQKQLEKDWSLSLRQAIKERKMEWQHNDILLNMKNKGWDHEALETIQLDY